MADFFLRPPTLAAGNFEAHLPTNSKFSALKDLSLLKKCNKYQETSDNFRLGFAMSNRPHFNSVCLVRVPSLTGIAVCGRNLFQLFSIVGLFIGISRLNFGNLGLYVSTLNMDDT